MIWVISACLLCVEVVRYNPFNLKVHHSQGFTNRCRLPWLTKSPLEYEPKCRVGGGGVAGLQGYSCAHGAQINFGDLTPYLPYAHRVIAHIEHWPTQPLLTQLKQKHLPVAHFYYPSLPGYAVECILYTFGRLPARGWKYWQVRLLNQQIIPHSTPNCSYSAIHSVHSM